LLGTNADDSRHLETPLALAAAGQFVEGPGSLYGPFRGGNHRVLIQAPLYYRLTGLAAWPLVGGLGLPPLSACLAAGRLISFLAFSGTLAAAYRLASMAGGGRRAGIWAALLLASSWLVGEYTVTLRPDLLGVWLQTAGTLAVLRAREAGRPRGLVTAAVCFALAACVKQHDLASAAVSLAVLGREALRRPDWRNPLARALLVGAGLAAGYYVAEDLLTSGRIERSVLGMSREVGRAAPGGISNILALGYGTLTDSFPLVVFALACRLAGAPADRGGPFDATLRLYFAAEAALALVLYYGSQGAWLNYAIPGVVYASVLTGRGLSRACAPGPGGRRAWVVGAAALAVGAAYCRDLPRDVRDRVVEEVMIDTVMRDPKVRGRPASEIYFPGLPGYNRRFGRLDLAHDEWLYGFFERAGEAEPRAGWLRPALLRSVRLVIVPDDPPISFPTDPPTPPGLDEPLPDLGYASVLRVGRYRVWERLRPPKGDSPAGVPRP